LDEKNLLDDGVDRSETLRCRADHDLADVDISRLFDCKGFTMPPVTLPSARSVDQRLSLTL
jgi:hypothetical protein